MKAYKGFNKDMTCRAFHFEEGKTYETETAKLCESGFHACEHPLNCFQYYPPSKSVYHEVELEEVSEERDDDTKIVGRKITVGARLSVADLVKAAVDFTFARAKWLEGSKASGYQGAAQATGDWGAAQASGHQGVASALGINGKAMGVIGCWIVCAEWAIDNGVWQRIDVKCAHVDGKTIKADTWYRLRNGEFVEAGNNEE